MITIIVADDHAIFRQGLLKMLASVGNISVMGEAADGDSALRLICDARPDIAVLDISMPGISGIDMVREVSNRGLPAKIILLTMYNDPITAGKALKAGVYGYAIKDSAFEELVTAIRKVAAGERFVSPEIEKKRLKLSPDNNKHSYLTEREREVLQLIAGGFTNPKIAERLCITLKTVESHRMHILQKLDLHNAADLTRYAIKEDLL